jgi:hypothetical protein
MLQVKSTNQIPLDLCRHIMWKLLQALVYWRGHIQDVWWNNRQQVSHLQQLPMLSLYYSKENQTIRCQHADNVRGEASSFNPFSVLSRLNVKIRIAMGQTYQTCKVTKPFSRSRMRLNAVCMSAVVSPMAPNVLMSILIVFSLFK